MKILFVDDDVEVVELLENIVDWKVYGFSHTFGAANGLEALNKLENQSVDVVITDISMPGMDGYELVHRLKIKNPKLQVVFLTCHEEFEYAHKAIAIGTDDYLLKFSLTKEVIEQEIEKLAEKRNRYLGIRNQERSKNERRNVQNEDVQAVINYIDKFYGKKITLQTAAKFIYKNSSYLSRLFKQETKKSFTDYLVEKRIRVATSLLKETDLSIEEIAERIGLDNGTYFYKFYKRETGQTPNFVRKNVSENSEKQEDYDKLSR